MNPNVLCFTDTAKILAYYLVVAYAIYSGKAVIIAFINKRATFNDLFAPRIPEEVAIDTARKMGVEVVNRDRSELDQFPFEVVGGVQ